MSQVNLLIESAMNEPECSRSRAPVLNGKSICLVPLCVYCGDLASRTPLEIDETTGNWQYGWLYHLSDGTPICEPVSSEQTK